MRSLPWGLWATLALFWVAVLLAGFLSATTVRDVRILRPEAHRDVDLPFEWPDGAPSFEFTAQANFPLASRAFVTLRADDCIRSIEVDGRTTFLSYECNPCQHCEFTRFPIPPDMAHGERTIRVRAGDTGGGAEFDIREARNFPPAAFLLFGLLGTVAMVTSWRHEFPVSRTALGLLGGLLAVLYFEATPAVIRSHDFGEHLEYLEALATRHALPLPGQWESHQPPLYYVVGALFKGAIFKRWFLVKTAYQAVSLLCFLLAVAVGVVTWQRIHRATREHPWASWAGISCFIFIPAHLFLSARVNNDAILPLLGALAIGLCWRYSEEPSRSGALALGLVSALALSAKFFAGGVAAAAVASVAWEARQRKTPPRETLTRLACVALPAIAVIVLWIGRNFYLLGSFMQVPEPASDLLVPNTAAKFLSFLYRPYLSSEFFDPYGGEIRNSFPTAVLVSALSGEFTFPELSPLELTLERIFFLAPVGAALFGALRGSRISVRLWLPCVVASAVSVSLLALFQLTRSYGCNLDARYLSAAFFPIAALVALGAASIDEAAPRLARYVLHPSFLAFGALLGLFWFYLTVR